MAWDTTNFGQTRQWRSQATVRARYVILSHSTRCVKLVVGVVQARAARRLTFLDQLAILASQVIQQEVVINSASDLAQQVLQVIFRILFFQSYGWVSGSECGEMRACVSECICTWIRVNVCECIWAFVSMWVYVSVVCKCLWMYVSDLSFCRILVWMLHSPTLFPIYWIQMRCESRQVRAHSSLVRAVDPLSFTHSIRLCPLRRFCCLCHTISLSWEEVLDTSSTSTNATCTQRGMYSMTKHPPALSP